MRADGMGRGVARLYAKRREALDQYVPLWVMPGQGGQASGQGGQASGQGTDADKSLKNKAGQGGQGKQGTETATDESTGAHTRVAKATPRERPQQQPASLHGSENCLVHPVHPVRASAGAGLLGQGTAPSPCPPCPWTDDRGWIGEFVRAEPGDSKLAILFRWVIAAGGWIEGTTAKLPALPAGMARNELRRVLRQHGIVVHEAAP
jgi:hypothetical protein